MDATTGALSAVLFDVDGTLVDSERHGHRVAFNAAFAELGLPYAWDEEEYGELLAVPGGRRRLAWWLSRQGHSRQEAEELAAVLHERKTQRFLAACRAGAVPARDGVVPLLDELAGEGLTVGVVTTGSRAWVLPLLDALFGAGRFATIVTGDEAPRRKPHPDAYHAALRDLGVPAPRVVAVEDSQNGVRAAVAAALPCLAVTNDYTRGDDLSGARLVVTGFGTTDAPARVTAGRPDLLRDGRVDVRTLAAVAAGRPE